MFFWKIETLFNLYSFRNVENLQGARGEIRNDKRVGTGNKEDK